MMMRPAKQFDPEEKDDDAAEEAAAVTFAQNPDDFPADFGRKPGLPRMCRMRIRAYAAEMGYTAYLDFSG